MLAYKNVGVRKPRVGSIQSYVASSNLSVIRQTFQNLFLILLFLSAITFTVACLSKTQSEESIVITQKNPKQDKKFRPCKNEPLYSLFPDDATTKNMRTAWEKFASSGRYRVACDSDSDVALDAVEPKTYESYSRDKQDYSATSWGDLNYPMRGYDDHLIVIVVDTTRTDINRFGLVIISPSASKKNDYDVNWLYQNRDLSRASVGKASGSAYVQDYTTDGKRDLCWIKWNKLQKMFVCNRDSSL